MSVEDAGVDCFVIGTERTGTTVRTVVRASQGAGVLTVLKHFPGLGRVRANTDTSTRAVDGVATANDPNLQPFAGGIAAVLLPPFVMLAVAPMLLFMIPLALFAIPFMISAFAGEAREIYVVPRRVPALRHVTP